MFGFGPYRLQVVPSVASTWYIRTDPLASPSLVTQSPHVSVDSINLQAQCVGDGFTVGFGNCEGTVLPAHSSVFQKGFSQHFPLFSGNLLRLSGWMFNTHLFFRKTATTTADHSP